MSDESPDLDRRRFGARLAAGAAALPLTLAAMSITEGSDEKPDAKPPEAKPAPFNPLALQLEMLERKYPSENLTPEGLRIIVGKLAGQMANSNRLSEFPLTNADGPGFVFSAYRGKE